VSELTELPDIVFPVFAKTDRIQQPSAGASTYHAASSF